QFHDGLTGGPATLVRLRNVTWASAPSENFAPGARTPSERRAASSVAIELPDRSNDDARMTCRNAAASMGRSGLGWCEPASPGRAPSARAAVSAALATVLLGRM